jgi:U3 small nucleolar RNA-associated protein 12
MVHPLASLPIASRHKVSQITFHPSHPFLAIQSHDRTVEIFRIRTEEEMRKKQARRLKRAKEKKKETKKNKEDDHSDEERADDQSQGLVKEIQLVDLYTPYTIVRAAGKVRSFDFMREENDGNHIQVRLLQAERRPNADVIYRYSPLRLPIPQKCSLSRCPPKTMTCPSLLEFILWTFPVTEQISERCLSVLTTNYWRQHRTVSSIYRSSTVLTLFDTGGLKIWNLKTLACIRTLECGHAICSSFLPGDRHVRVTPVCVLLQADALVQVVVGTKSGNLLLYNVASAELIDTIKAHSSTIWSLHVRPDFSGLVTGSADKDIKFWDLKEVKDSEVGTNTLYSWDSP